MARINPLADQKPTVEPVQRMVGGRYGFAYHRFPIKGGITPLQALQAFASQHISDAVNRVGYFAALSGDDKVAPRPRMAFYSKENA